MLGLLVLLLLNAQKLSNYVKENIQFQVYLDEDAREVEVLKLKKIVDAEPYTRSTEYITKEQAAQELKQEVGEDFVEFLGYNPLMASLDISLNAAYANTDSIAKIENELRESPVVSDVVYSPDLIRQVNENINRIGIIILAFSLLLLVIAVALINNTIRLAIYSKRLLIRSMQLVGATRWFITKPFIGSGLLNGIIAGLIAIVLILGVLYLAQQEIPEFFELTDLIMFAELFGAVLLLGIFISGISTWLAVRRFLRMPAEKIF